MTDNMITPDKWAPPLQEAPHDHKGHSEEKCVRCGWVMGYPPLNCMNNDSPHVFPSQQAEIGRLRAENNYLVNCLERFHSSIGETLRAHDAWQEALNRD